MIVYRVTSDLEYQGVLSDDNKTLMKLTETRAEPIGEASFPDCYITSMKEKRGNFFSTSSGNLLGNDIAIEVLKPVLPDSCEYFKISVQDLGQLTFINILTKYDSLDEDNTMWRAESDGSRNIILKYEFEPLKLAAAPCLFKIPQHRYARLFTVTKRSGSEDDFYTRYHEAGLTGLEFSKLWSSEN